MARHPGAGQEKMRAWLSPRRAELTLRLSSPAAQDWCCRREGGRVGAKGAGVTEGSCPKRHQLRTDEGAMERDVLR